MNGYQSQRIRITEKGWENFSSHFGGVEFVNGLSVEPVSPSVMNHLGSIIRVEAVDSMAQVGYAKVVKDSQNTGAAVQKELERTSENGQSKSKLEKPTVVVTDRYSKVDLEAIADEKGITGLREIASKLGLKGRGIAELIDEIYLVAGKE